MTRYLIAVLVLATVTLSAGLAAALTRQPATRFIYVDRHGCPHPLPGGVGSDYAFAQGFVAGLWAAESDRNRAYCRTAR